MRTAKLWPSDNVRQNEYHRSDLGVLLRLGPMPNQRYVPRDYMTRPDKFGRQHQVEWKMPDGGTRAHLAASQIQHYLCVRIHDAIKTAGDKKTIRAYTEAASAGATDEEDVERLYRRAGRVMRGEAIMRLDDIAIAQIHFGDELGLPDWLAS